MQPGIFDLIEANAMEQEDKQQEISYIGVKELFADPNELLEDASELFNEEADGEDSISEDDMQNGVSYDLRERFNESNLNNNGGGGPYNAPNASDNDAHNGMPHYLRGKLDEGEAVTLVDGPEITHNDINLGELFESDTSIEGKDWSDDGTQNGMPHDMRERRNESNLNNDKGGAPYSAPNVFDDNAWHGMSPDFRGLFDEGETVTLVDGPEITTWESYLRITPALGKKICLSVF